MNKIWIYSIAIGIVPAIFWLIFWTREDKDTQPEPKVLILKTFLFGALAAILALSIEAILSKSWIDMSYQTNILSFAFIEEFVKFFVIYKIALKTRFNNERSDPVLYMIIGALGFAAIENIFYLIDYINHSFYIKSMITGSYRFIGAMLIHTISSAFIGITCSMFFFKSLKLKWFLVLISLAIATIMHSLFNFFVNSKSEFYHNLAFYGSWISIIILLIIFEYLRRDWRLRPRNLVRIHLASTTARWEKWKKK